MGENVFYIILICVVISFCNFLMYDSNEMKSARFWLGIMLLAALIAPVFSVFKSVLSFDVGSFEDYTEESEFADEVAKKALADGIRRSIADKYSISEEDIEVELIGFNIEKMKAERVYITLSSKAALADSKAIRDYVEKCGFGECITEVRF